MCDSSGVAVDGCEIQNSHRGEALVSDDSGKYQQILGLVWFNLVRNGFPPSTVLGSSARFCYFQLLR